MIGDKYLKQLVNMDEGEIAELVNIDGTLEEPFQRLTAEHGEIRDTLSQVIENREAVLWRTLSCIMGFEEQCSNILKKLEELEEAGQETAARIRAELFIASLVETVARVRAELFITSQIDQCLYRVLVDDGGGDQERNKKKYQRIWKQFKYIRCTGFHHDPWRQIPPWWWLCDDIAGEDTAFLNDHQELIGAVARKYWKDFLKTAVIKDKDEIMKKVRQSIWEGIEGDERRRPEGIRKLIKEIL